MNWSGALVVAGYIALMCVAGWIGVLAAVAHICVLLICAKMMK